MFNIPGKQALTITETATAQIRKLMEQGNKKGLRVGVKKGGCAGMEYTMNYVDDIDPNDEIITQNGATVMIAPMARCFYLGQKLITKCLYLKQALNLTTQMSQKLVGVVKVSNLKVCNI